MVCSNSVSIQAGCYDVQGRPWTLTAVPGCRTVTISWFQQHDDDVASLRSSDIPTVVVLVQRDVQRQVFQRPMLSLRRSAHLELTVTEGSMQE